MPLQAARVFQAALLPQKAAPAMDKSEGVLREVSPDVCTEGRF